MNTSKDKLTFVQAESNKVSVFTTNKRYSKAKVEVTFKKTKTRNPYGILFRTVGKASGAVNHSSL